MISTESVYIKIIHLFSGEASTEEKKAIEDWLSTSGDNQKLYADLQDIWLGSGLINNAYEYNLEQTIRQFRERVAVEKKRNIRKKLMGNILKYAAITLLFLALPLSYWLGKNGGLEKDSFTTVTCALGDKTNLILPDSSKVWLNSGSKIIFNNDFIKGKRQVFLEGEAYFSVTDDKRSPFRVKTSEFEIEVLGTEFNLKAYTDETMMAATLVEGSLKVSNANEEKMVKPKQKLVFNKESSKMKLYELTDVSAETQWKDGRLVFRNESLLEIQPKLERWFDVDIVFADDNVKQSRFTGILERESILEVISYFGHSKYVGSRIEDNIITFFSKQ